MFFIVLVFVAQFIIFIPLSPKHIFRGAS